MFICASVLFYEKSGRLLINKKAKRITVWLLDKAVARVPNYTSAQLIHMLFKAALFVTLPVTVFGGFAFVVQFFTFGKRDLAFDQ